MISEYFEDLSFWDTRRVTDMSNMFRGLVGDVNVERWDTSGVASMAGMFYGASQFTGDIGAWDVGKVRDATAMFEGATALLERNKPTFISGLLGPRFGRAYV